MKNPKVSIIASSFNTPKRYLLDCVNSMLNQTFCDFEFFIVDDCSTNGKVRDILSDIVDHRIILIENEVNLGLAMSLNKCIERASGEYIVRMDTDDISMRDRLQRQIEYMDEHPKCDIMSGRTCMFTDSGEFWLGSTYYGDSNSVNIELFFDSTLLHPSVIIRKSFLDKNKLMYDADCKRAQDYNLWVRSSLIGADIRSVEDYYIFYRQHKDAASKKDRGSQVKVVLDIHKQYLDKLGIEWTEKNKKLHECFCNPYDYDSYNVKDMVIWCGFLINQNNITKVFKSNYFKYGVIKRLFGGVKLHYISGNIKIKDIMYVTLNVVRNPTWVMSIYKIIITKNRQKNTEKEHYTRYIKKEWEKIRL